MKAFNKIYIPFVDLGEDGLCQAPIWWDKNKQDEKPECKGTIEYIRKDALLEWAKEKNERIDADEGDYSLGYVSAMIDLIDKLSSM